MLLYVNLKMASEPYLGSFITSETTETTPNKSGLFRSADFLLSIVILHCIYLGRSGLYDNTDIQFHKKMEWWWLLHPHPAVSDIFRSIVHGISISIST